MTSRRLIPIMRGAGGSVSTWDRGNPAKGGNVIAASGETLLEQALRLIHA